MFGGGLCSPLVFISKTFILSRQLQKITIRICLFIYLHCKYFRRDISEIRNVIYSVHSMEKIF